MGDQDTTLVRRRSQDVQIREKTSAESLFDLRGFAAVDHVARRYLEHCRIGFRAGDLLHPNRLRAIPRVLARDRQIYL